MLLLKLKVHSIFLTSIIFLLSLISLSCSSDKYPENYGVYLCENMNPVKRIEINDKRTEINGITYNYVDLNKLPCASNNSPISIWFYDPKRVPTELWLGRIVPFNLVHGKLAYGIDAVQDIPFDTKPIDNKLGLFRIEINKSVEEGIYSLYADNFNTGSKKRDVQWAFLIITKKSKSSFKDDILGKWYFPPSQSTEFMQNGEIKFNNEKYANYKFISSDSLQIETVDNKKAKYKIVFISRRFLYMELKDESGRNQSLFLDRQEDK